MKLRTFVIAIIAAATLSANAAGISSLDQNVLRSTMNSGYYVSIAGDSDMRAAFRALAASVLLNPVYYVDAGTISHADSNYMAVSGVLRTANPPYGNGAPQWVIHLSVSDDSYNGIFSVVRNVAIDALDVTNCSTTEGAGTADSPYICATRGPISGSQNPALSSAGLVPDAGTSEVSPQFFTVVDNLKGEYFGRGLSEAELWSLNTTPLYVQGFGIPMTTNISSSFVMTQPIYSALMTGAFTDWNQVPGSTDSGPLVICRRIPGAQVVTNLFAGNVGCTASSISTVDRSSSAAYVPAGSGNSYQSFQASRVGTANGTGLIVIENNTSADVRKCMDAAYFGGTYVTTDRSSNKYAFVDFGSGGYKAIGVLSMNNLPFSSSTVATRPTLGNANGAWQFRSLNGSGKITGQLISSANASNPVAPVTSGTGILPTLANIQTGDWSMQGYKSFNMRSSVGDVKGQVLSAFSSTGQSAAVLRNIRELSWASLALPDIVTGNVTATSNQASVVSAAYASNDQCAPLQRQY